MIRIFLVGFVAGAISMFYVIRNGYIKVGYIVIRNKNKKKRTPKDLELGNR
jgi:hypothetical protein